MLADKSKTSSRSASSDTGSRELRADLEPVQSLGKTLDANHPGRSPDVAVIIPCFNEAATIAEVVVSFRRALPLARIYVFDNNSTDETSAIARAAGANIYHEPRAGKGNVVRRMFAEIDADVYVMVDGDGTYDAIAAPLLVKYIVDDHIDMVIGARENIHQNAHRAGHAFGNVIFNSLYRAVFGTEFGDIFSGYRAFSRRFVKSFPALSSGFEIETELSVHAGQLKLPVAEIVLPYGKRPEGSASKLNSVRDGLKILKTFVMLAKETRPAMFFGCLAALPLLLAAILAIPVVVTYLTTGLVPRLPTVVACTGLVLIASVFTICGLILDSIARFRIENKRILYLAIKK
eukprot:gene2514-2553_t